MAIYYKLEIICDIIEMDGCHILLSRLWQIDVDAVNEDKENTYKIK